MARDNLQSDQGSETPEESEFAACPVVYEQRISIDISDLFRNASGYMEISMQHWIKEDGSVKSYVAECVAKGDHDQFGEWEKNKIWEFSGDTLVWRRKGSIRDLEEIEPVLRAPPNLAPLFNNGLQQDSKKGES